MSKNSKIQIVVSAFLFAIFIAYTILVKTVDVANIGPQFSEVGFSEINGYFAKLFTFNEAYYNISAMLGVIPIVAIGAFAVAGLIQLIKRKSLFKVDKPILALGCYAVVVVVLYVFFEVVKVNYRPVILEGKLSPSFPSTHTLLAVAIMGAVAVFLVSTLERKLDKIIAVIVCIAIALSVVITRFISGVHWFTDIIGGILLSAALITAYSTALSILNHKNK